MVILYVARCPICQYEGEYDTTVTDPQCVYGCGTMVVICPECGKETEDDRTRNGMKCEHCAYGF